MSTELEGSSMESQPADEMLTSTPLDSPSAAVISPAQAPVRNAPPERRGNSAADAEDKRKRQALELQRERILSERTNNPHRRSALAAALIDIEEKLSELGWTIHL